MANSSVSLSPQLEKYAVQRPSRWRAFTSLYVNFFNSIKCMAK